MLKQNFRGKYKKMTRTLTEMTYPNASNAMQKPIKGMLLKK